MLALDASLEMVALIFLLAAFAYAMRLLQLTANAEIVGLGKPKTVFRLMAFGFASLLLSPILELWSEFFHSLPLLTVVQRILLILTAFFSVTALYTALYFYRTSPEKQAAIPEGKNAQLESFLAMDRNHLGKDTESPDYYCGESKEHAKSI